MGHYSGELLLPCFIQKWLTPQYGGLERQWAGQVSHESCDLINHKRAPVPSELRRLYVSLCVRACVCEPVCVAELEGKIG